MSCTAYLASNQDKKQRITVSNIARHDGLMDYCLLRPKWSENLASNIAVVSFLCALDAVSKKKFRDEVKISDSLSSLAHS